MRGSGICTVGADRLGQTVPVCSQAGAAGSATIGCEICGSDICTGQVTWAGSCSESEPLFGESGAGKSAFIGSLITNSCGRIAWGVNGGRTFTRQVCWNKGL